MLTLCLSSVLSTAVAQIALDEVEIRCSLSHFTIELAAEPFGVGGAISFTIGVLTCDNGYTDMWIQ